MPVEEQEDELELATEDEEQEEVDGEEPALVVKLGDDLIAVIRELVQLTIITGTNVVDHLRAVTCEIDEDTSKLVPTEDYILAYNKMVEQLVRQAEEAQQKQETNLVESGVFGKQDDDPKNIN